MPPEARTLTMAPPVSAGGADRLLGVFQAINAQTEFTALVDEVLHHFLGLTGGRAAALFLANKTTGDLDVSAVHEIPEKALAAYVKRPARSQWLRGEPDAAARALAAHPEALALASAGYPHHRFVPICIQSQSVGCLSVASDRPLFSAPEIHAQVALFIEFIAQRIENAFLIYQLRQQNAHLELMMTKLQNAQNSLRRAEKMALMGKIAAGVAHEIRNPLTIIGTSLQMIYEKMPAEHCERELYEVMIGKVRSMDQIIKELLTVARPLTIRAEAVHVSDSMAAVATLMRKKLELKALRLVVEIPKDLPCVRVDDEQFQRVMINLLLNAHHFTPEGGEIRVCAQTAPGQSHIQLWFKDSGPGIPPEKETRIFEPFFTTRRDGTGLGLFLVKHLLEAMNGSIEIRHSGEPGAQFLLKLPIADRA